MKVVLKRHGIAIRSYEIDGSSASIGSGADCVIRIEDPYLSPHIADLRLEEGTWRIRDSGRSLDGVTRDGRRVDDEAVDPGAAYVIGGFELVLEAAAPASVARPADSSIEEAPTHTRRPHGFGDAAIPATVMEPLPSAPLIPATRMEPLPSWDVPATVVAPMPRAPQRQSSAAPPPSRVVQPVKAAVQEASSQAAPPRKSQRRKIVVLLFIIVGLLALAAVKEGRRSKTAAPPKAVVSPVAAPVVAVARPTPPPPPPPRTELDMARELDTDGLLTSWETKLTASPDPALRARHSKLAADLALVHAANGDRTRAQQYAERAVKFGEPSSPDVLRAAAIAK